MQTFTESELIALVRDGDTAAYEELYRRHVDIAMSVARHLTRSTTDAEDVVSEAFMRVLAALRRGRGPEMVFRPYLLTSVRNAFHDRSRKDERLDVTDEVPEDLDRVLAAAATSEDEVERRLAAAASASLPERWQLVLWHTEVGGRGPAEVAPLLGLAPNAAAALAYRAREGLRQAYLNAHIQARPPAGCKDIVPRLGAYIRDALSARDQRKVEEHLSACERCQAIVAEGRDTSASWSRSAACHRSTCLPVAREGGDIPPTGRDRPAAAGPGADGTAGGVTSLSLALAVRMVAGVLRPADEPTTVELPLDVGELVELVRALVIVAEHVAAFAMSESFMIDSVPEVVMSMAGQDAVFQAPDRTRADWAAKAVEVIEEVRWALEEMPHEGPELN